MLTVNKVVPQGRGLAAVLLKRASSVELDWDTRQKSRFDATDSAGRALGVFLSPGSVVRGGDVLVAEDGSLIRVQAAPQPVLLIRTCAEHGSPFDLMRAAYHLGNRHVAIELSPEQLKIEPDHVLQEMLQRMHLIVSPANEAFDPEGGAYRSAASHAHDRHAEHAPGQAHAHDHDHDHDRDHDHDHGHDHGHGHDHDHGHDHEHGHDHRHGHG